MRRKLPLKPYPPDQRLVGMVMVAGEDVWIHSLDESIEDTAKLCGAWSRLVKKHEAGIAQLVSELGRDWAVFLLAIDALRLAQRGASILKSNNDLSIRWRDLSPRSRSFMEQWTADIFSTLLRTNAAAKVTAILRSKSHVRAGGDPKAKLFPIKDARDKEIAEEAHTTTATVQKARLRLAKLDASFLNRCQLVKKNRGRGRFLMNRLNEAQQ